MSPTPLPDHLDPATRRRLERDFEDLRSEFTPRLGAEVVEQCLQEAINRLTTRGRQSVFAPLLAPRIAREQLVALDQAEEH